MWVSWTVDMGDVGMEAAEVLGKILDAFNAPTLTDKTPKGFKELIVGHIVEE